MILRKNCSMISSKTVNSLNDIFHKFKFQIGTLKYWDSTNTSNVKDSVCVQWV